MSESPRGNNQTGAISAIAWWYWYWAFTLALRPARQSTMLIGWFELHWTARFKKNQPTPSWWPFWSRWPSFLSLSRIFPDESCDCYAPCHVPARLHDSLFGRWRLRFLQLPILDQRRHASVWAERPGQHKQSGWLRGEAWVPVLPSTHERGKAEVYGFGWLRYATSYSSPETVRGRWKLF